MALSALVNSISRSTSGTNYDTGLTTAFGQIIVVKGPNYDDKQMRQLPALLFEFYSDTNLYLENMNRLWTYDNNQPIQLVRMPTDTKVKIVPIFNEDYISRLDTPDNTFDLTVYIDPNVSF